MNGTFWQEVEEWIKLLATGTFEDFWSQFLKPYHLLTLALELKRRQNNKYEKPFSEFLELPEELASYAARMKLWQAAGMRFSNKNNKSNENNNSATSIASPTIEGTQTGRFLPVQKLINNQVVNKTAGDLVKIGVKQNLKYDTVNSLEVMLIELLNNYYDHSNSEDHLYGLACAQSWPRGNLAQIALVDSGMGIRQSLQQNKELHPLLKTNNACALSCEYGITSKPNAGHSGYGLTLAKEMMKGNQGNLILISYDEGFVQSGQESETFKISPIWKGTLLILEWNINAPLSTSVNDIYSQWPTPEGFEY